MRRALARFVKHAGLEETSNLRLPNWQEGDIFLRRQQAMSTENTKLKLPAFRHPVARAIARR
jgi:hypothetical protein